jgi:NAD(P)-dependent dehydrogenase (short-subunit alcohol dehydrogenase family)
MKEVIVVTGASSGFGVLAARAGHPVYASMHETSGRNAPRVAEVKNTQKSTKLICARSSWMFCHRPQPMMESTPSSAKDHPNIETLVADTAETEDGSRTMARAIELCGRLNVLVNNADAGEIMPLAEATAKRIINERAKRARHCEYSEAEMNAKQRLHLDSLTQLSCTSSLASLPCHAGSQPCIPHLPYGGHCA